VWGGFGRLFQSEIGQRDTFVSFDWGLEYAVGWERWVLCYLFFPFFFRVCARLINVWEVEELRVGVASEFFVNNVNEQ